MRLIADNAAWPGFGHPSGMWPYFPELLSTPVPRYTSFPTAAEFTDSVGTEEYRDALAGAEGDISLYIHIPFCENICWYCGCNTARANRVQRLTSYLDAVHREIVLVAGYLPAAARVRRIAFGGGSPNAITPDEFVRLHRALAENFTLAQPTISVEIDPRTLTGDWAAAVGTVGASHASLGVQTFVPHLQEAIGRVQPLCQIDRAVRSLRAAGINSLNFDLMYGLPGQTENDLSSTLELATSFGADRIALFGYAHVPHLIPRQRRIDGTLLPDQYERFRMAALGHACLEKAGYRPIGFDHFALGDDPIAKAAASGRLRRNFQGFTDDQADILIGLGASAISSFPHLLVQNEKNSGRYRMMLSQDRLAPALGKCRDRDDRRRGAIIQRLLCDGHARLDAASLAEATPRLASFRDAGLCKIEGETLLLTPHALPYSRSIAACFDPYRQQSPRRFSSAI